MLDVEGEMVASCERGDGCWMWKERWLLVVKGEMVAGCGRRDGCWFVDREYGCWLGVERVTV